MPQLRRMWIGMLTHSAENAETDSQIVLIVNENGIERLHHTFFDTPQRDQERGQANLYEVKAADAIDVFANTILTQNLSNSSIRVGIRGDDAWRPEHLFVWGQGVQSEILPLGMEINLSTALSSDVKEGPISIPVRLVNVGNLRTGIGRLLMLMTTRDNEDAGTDSPVRLQINLGSGPLVVDFPIPNTPQDEQERGQANLYFVPTAEVFTKSMLNDSSIHLSIEGDDAWQPESFFLFGIDGGTPATVVPLVHLPSWPFGTMSTDSSEGVASVTLPLS